MFNMFSRIVYYKHSMFYSSSFASFLSFHSVYKVFSLCLRENARKRKKKSETKGIMKRNKRKKENNENSIDSCSIRPVYKPKDRTRIDLNNKNRHRSYSILPG